MNTPSPSSPVEPQVRCWCGQTRLEDFSPDYWRCPECQTLVLREMRGEEISQVRDDEHDFYGKSYYLHHVQQDYGLPDLETRARADLPERCLHWLRTVLKFVPGPGARTLELGCGHGGFVAMQRWAGLDATGLELSPWLVGKAREWFGVPVLEGRLEDQELAPASWDAVILMDVLEHLPDPRRTLGRAVSLLRSPSGFLLIQTPCYPAGWSYEALLAQDHPFLQQLKPQEHLYLFSEQAVEHLCVELGVGQVRFEPAIFAHYDLFAVASAGPLRERPLPERTEMLMAASPPARWTLALLDLGEVRDEGSVRLAAATAEGTALRQMAETQNGEITRLHATTNELWPRLDATENARNLLAAQLADLQRQFTGVEADHAARLEVIEAQGAEIARLHAEVDHRLKEATEFWPRLDATENARNLLAAQLADLQRQFTGVEADHAARLQVIETQGAEIARLHAEVDHRLKEATEFWPRLDATENARNLLAAQLADLQRQFTGVEADHAARLQVIETQGAEIARLHAEVDHRLKEAIELWPRLDATENARNLLAAQMEDLRGHFERGEGDRLARLEIIETQGAEIAHLHAEVDHRLKEATEFWPRLDATENARNLLAAQLADLQRQFTGVEADHAARLQVIETQGAEIARLHAEVDHRLKEATEFWPKLDAALNARNLLAAQMEDLRGHYERGEADRAARLQVIETQGAEIGHLQTEANRWLHEVGELRPRLEQTLQERDLLTAQFVEARTGFEAEGAARREVIANHEATITRLQAQLASTESERAVLRKRKKTLDAHWTAWLLKRLRLWPLD